MIIDYKNLISKENINLIGVLNNNDFNEITGKKSVGHYQYDKKEKYFTFREQLEIHNLKKIQMSDFLNCLDDKLREISDISDVEIKNNDGKYILFFNNADGKKHSFQRSNKNIMDLIIEFYFHLKKENYLKKAS